MEVGMKHSAQRLVYFFSASLLVTGVWLCPPAFSQHALDANLSVSGPINPVQDPLARSSRRYLVDDNFGGGQFEARHRLENFGSGSSNGERAVGRSLKNEVEGSSGWKVYDSKLSAMRSAENEARQKLRQTGQKLELSATYQADMRIDSLPARTDRTLGDCRFYEDLLQTLSVQKGTAVESKIRKLKLKESEQFLDLYQDRLKSQGRLTDELRDKLDHFRRQIGEDQCSIKGSF
jgi:hypothetical protein